MFRVNLVCVVCAHNGCIRCQSFYYFHFAVVVMCNNESLTMCLLLFFFWKTLLLRVLSLQKQGGDSDCSCEDFTVPIPRDEVPGWLSAHEENKRRLRGYAERDVDVVFLGDDVIEEWNGKRLNSEIAQDGEQIANDFQKIFNSDHRNSLALGIAGDSVRTMLSIFWVIVTIVPVLVMFRKKKKKEKKPTCITHIISVSSTKFHRLRRLKLNVNPCIANGD